MYYIGIDLGGTNIAAGIVDEKGKILLKKSVPTCAEKGGEYIVKAMSELVMDLIKTFEISFDDVKSIGIGSPGTIDKKNGKVLYANNIDFNDMPVRAKMIEYFGREIDIYIDNDANCAAWAEFVAGAAKGVQDAIMITLGTGVGGGIIVNGKLYSGFNYCGGELGHVVIEKNGVPCNCGRVGCWESYSSATALIRMTREKAEENKDSLMWEYYNEKGAWSGRTAFLAADKGDKAAKEVVDTYIDYLACGIVNMINIFQPEIFVIGGGVANEGENLFAPLREKAKSQVYGGNSGVAHTKIVGAETGNDAGIIGAALLDE
ncbi:MAG: ROK family protein [Clostridia bacterium]|nr:ROK family protein [Clostridia bacterium]